MKLYHGSDIAIERPEIAYNKGFSDLGRGFYLTDDYEVACQRALSRARTTSAPQGAVSIFEFNEDAITWIELGSDEGGAEAPHGNFGLRFADTLAGVIAWAHYIMACRQGRTEIDGVGDPAVVRAWIATEDIEMICAGFAPAEELAPYINTADLVVQYCFRSQLAIDQHLVFEKADYLYQ